MTPATASYVAIGSAADDDANDGAQLVGHLYCRYFADLFGGQALAAPTRLALGLGEQPRHYTFDFIWRTARLIEAHEEINAAGERLGDDDQRARVARPSSRSPTTWRCTGRGKARGRLGGGGGEPAEGCRGGSEWR